MNTKLGIITGLLISAVIVFATIAMVETYQAPTQSIGSSCMIGYKESIQNGHIVCIELPHTPPPGFLGPPVQKNISCLDDGIHQCMAQDSSGYIVTPNGLVY